VPREHEEPAAWPLVQLEHLTTPVQVERGRVESMDDERLGRDLRLVQARRLQPRHQRLDVAPAVFPRVPLVASGARVSEQPRLTFGPNAVEGRGRGVSRRERRERHAA
jgi:hypothetical protein